MISFANGLILETHLNKLIKRGKKKKKKKRKKREMRRRPGRVLGPH
jgi:hypothetical protein